jgi:glycine betaine/choline ABC-type transport system substrate-binding protein
LIPGRRRLPAALLAALLSVTILAAAACGDDDDSASGGAGDGVTVRIADKGFAESFIVAQAYAQALDAQGFSADVTSLASTEIADKAIRDGEIDVYPEYVGTAFQTVLGKDAASAPESREAQFEQVRTEYEGRGLTAGAVQQRQRRGLHPGGGRRVRHPDPHRPRQGVGQHHVLGQRRAPDAS